MKPALLFVGSIVFGAVAVVVAVWFARGGHGTYLPAKLLFPFSMLLTLLTGSIGFLGSVVAVLQFPVYGLALVAGTNAAQLRRLAAVVAVAHCAAAAAALALVPEATFPS